MMNALEPCPVEIDLQTVEFAGKLVDAAGALIQHYAGQQAKWIDRQTADWIEQWFKQKGEDIGLQRKDHRSPDLSNADLGAEKLMREMISKEYPEDGIVGEEFGETPSRSGRTWILDPVDGTTAYLVGQPTYTTLIGLTINDVPMLGVIDQPRLQDRWVGVSGRQTIFNGKPIINNPPSQPGSLSEATLLCTIPDNMFSEPDQKEVYRQLTQTVAATKLGGDGYNYGLVAAGQRHIMHGKREGKLVILEAGLAFYDIAPMPPIIEGAGGQITDWEGQPIDSQSFKGEIIASTDPSLHAELLEFIRNIR